MPAILALKAKQENDGKKNNPTQNQVPPSPDIQNGRCAVLSPTVTSGSIQQLQIPLCSPCWAAIQEKLQDYTSIFVLRPTAKARKLLRLLTYNIRVNGSINWVAVAVGGSAKWGVRVDWLAALVGGEGRALGKGAPASQGR